MTCSSVLGFVDDYAATVRHLSALLRPGGLFVQWDWERDDNDADPHGLAQAEIEIALTAASLDDVDVKVGFELAIEGATMRPLMGIGRKPHPRRSESGRPRWSAASPAAVMDTDVMNTSVSNTAVSNTQVLIASVPDGPLATNNFAVVDGARPEPGNGEVLVETAAITIGAGQRAGLQGSASYAGAAQADTVMTGTGIGTVTESRDSSIEAGATVIGPTGWQHWSAVAAKHLTVVPPGIDPAVQLGALGTNGLTAYFGLLDVGQPQVGETVVVSAAAGSVGHIVGQIAKIKGARVVGVAGSNEKCASLVDDFGFDVAVNYKSDDFRAEFKAATPDRIDVYYDNTGGDILGSALFRMNTFGRIVCCGAVSHYDTASPSPGPRGVPGLLVNNRVRMQGFLIFDYADRYPEARAELSTWIASGQLRPSTTEYDGLAAAPQAFVDLLAGATAGTTIVRV